jgi:hypothetical protein
MFTIILHLVAIPRIPVHTDKVVAVIRTGVAEVKINWFDVIQMGHTHSYPRSQFLYLHSPLFNTPID